MGQLIIYTHVLPLVIVVKSPRNGFCFEASSFVVENEQPLLLISLHQKCETLHFDR